MADPTCLALCAGIGGLELGVRAAIGARTVGYVERDAYAAAVLLARMEGEALEPAPVWCGELEDLDCSVFAGVDLVTAGFPCQPFSVAGERRGLEDHRWLWPAVARIIREVGPRLVFLENVPGIVRHGLAHVLGDLAALGFDAEWGLFRASDVGAPHRRERWFCLAHTRRRGDDEEQQESRPGGGGPAVSCEVGEDVADADRDGLKRTRLQLLAGEPRGAVPDSPGTGETMGDADGARHEGRGQTGPGGVPFAWPPGPDDTRAWAQVRLEAQLAIRRMADGLPYRVDRLRCLGNAVVPAQAELAFRALAVRLETSKLERRADDE